MAGVNPRPTKIRVTPDWAIPYRRTGSRAAAFDPVSDEPRPDATHPLCAENSLCVSQVTPGKSAD